MPDRPESSDVARTLIEFADPHADREVLEDRLFSQVYAELRSMARGLLRFERVDHTLRPTELVHEAYLRLVGSDPVTWEGRAHFFGAAARAMRQILVDHARRKRADKRGGGWQRVSLDPELAAPSRPDVDLLAFDSCLARLAKMDPRMSQVVELRVFGGLTIRDAAFALGVSERTVDGDWAVAKKWLRRELTREA